MALVVTPGYQFAAQEKATRAKLNLLGQPAVEIEDGTIPESWLDADLIARLTPPVNLFINPDFEIWPHGDFRGQAYTHSAVVAGSRKHDYAGVARWVTPNVATTRVLSRESFPAGQTVVPDYPQYFLRYIQSAALSGINPGYVGQRVENVEILAANTVTFSIWVRSPVSLTVTPSIRQNFGPDGYAFSADVTSLGTAVVLDADTWTKIEQVFEVPSVAGKVIAPMAATAINTTIGSFTEFRIVVPQLVTFQLDFAHAMLNYGSTAAFWDRRTRVQEDQLVERYFEILGFALSDDVSSYRPSIMPRQFMPFLLSAAGGGISGTTLGGGSGSSITITSAPQQIVYQQSAHSTATAFYILYLDGELHAPA